MQCGVSKVQALKVHKDVFCFLCRLITVCSSINNQAIHAWACATQSNVLKHQ